MLIQHILTEEIFSKVFGEDDFHRQNNIAKELYRLEGTFFTGNVKKQMLRGLDPYYAAIRAAAAQIGSHLEKQTFLKVISRISTRSITQRQPTGSASCTRPTKSCGS
jgi:predicted helicase